LRDVPTPIGVFQVRAPGLATDFPPLRALDTSPGNLRRAATSFIGRESEVAEVEAALRAHRLVTLTEMGGVGKTCLALEVAAHLTDEFPDGVWFCELAAVTDPASVPDAVAAVLGITQQPGMSVSDSRYFATESGRELLQRSGRDFVRHGQDRIATRRYQARPNAAIAYPTSAAMDSGLALPPDPFSGGRPAIGRRVLGGPGSSR